MTTSKKIVVTGDIVCAYDIFRGARSRSDSLVELGTTTRRARAGAYLLHGILDAVTAGDSELEAILGLECGADCEGRTEHRLWKPSARGETRAWGLEQSLGYGPPSSATECGVATDDEADVLVVEDAGIGFRHDTQKQAWPAELRNENGRRPETIVYRMKEPMAHGDLWRTVRARFADRTVLVTSIEDIRAESVRVTEGLSWERTVTELMSELAGNPAVSPLLSCRTLVVCLGSEGALVLDGPPGAGKHARLLFDPKGLEGEWAAAHEGGVPGRMACFVAALAHRFASPPLAEPVLEGARAGLSAARRLITEGYGPVGEAPPGFPMARVVAEIQKPGHHYGSVEIPHVDGRPSDRWAILSSDTFQGPLYGLGRRVALQGTKALSDAPHARFGKLFTTDRREMESLRNIRRLIRDYEQKDKGKKPLSIAVFGPPGSGKSFSIEEIAESALGKGVPTLVFNLSQFTGPEDLAGALHQVRDVVLAGRAPVVFWDEFDSDGYKWLQYLLSPMQDGAFREGQLEHKIGKCIFVFAGGTSWDFEHFGPSEKEEKAHREFRLKKGPDFKSRLASYLNVLGPNPRQVFDEAKEQWVVDETDVCAPIRRGLLLRVMLGIPEGKRLEIDPGVLSGLLELREYKHGARSLQTVVSHLKHRMTDGRIRRSDLPPAELMSLHAETEEFMRRADWDRRYEHMAERLAPAVHGFYCDHVKDRSEYLPYLKEFEALPEGIKDDNRAAAARIPRVLRMVGLYVVPCEGPDDKTDADAVAVIEENIELLAEQEHDGWEDHRRKNGWRLGERDDDAKLHPLMKPYADLNEGQKDKDRNGVRSYPTILDLASHKIVIGLPELPLGDG